MKQSTGLASPFHPALPGQAGAPARWGRLYGSGAALVIANAAAGHDGPLVVFTPDMPAAERLDHALRFYIDDGKLPLLILPDRETLPYDVFSPHQDIVSERLDALSRLPALKQGVVIVPVPTAMVRLPPRNYLETHSLRLEVGEAPGIDALRERLEHSGYRHVSQVMEHGEYCVRGSLLDLYPMGSSEPYRIDLFDKEIDSIRTFDPESQLSVDRVEAIRLMPAREFPLTGDAIDHFRQGFRRLVDGDPQRCPVYRDVSQGLAPAGIEYFLPLFFEQTMTLFDYLPANACLLSLDGCETAAEQYGHEIAERYEQSRHDVERPLLAPAQLFLSPEELHGAMRRYPAVEMQSFETEGGPGQADFALRAVPDLGLPPHARQPFAPLQKFLAEFPGRVLLVVETAGRREALIDLFRESDGESGGATLREVSGWRAFLDSELPLAITITGLDRGLLIEEPRIAVLTESQLFGDYVMQRRRRGKRRERDADAIVRNLAELEAGAAVVHEEHGVGRYLGLQTLDAGGVRTEFLQLEYADGDKLYIPVASLHLISRYTGTDPEHAPLHKLGSGQWQKARRRAAERARDAAAELLDIYSRREARQGRIMVAPDDEYAAFAAAFPFEETPDQQDAIRDVIHDLTSDRPMDRLVCGDVGFGKTEVAMRAAFIAVQSGAQVAVLVPTTLLAQQHYRNFQDRFADLAVRVDVLSRFRQGREQTEILERLENGKIDIIIGTHKLLQPTIRFKDLGLVIIDEEQRFGVRQKERLKALRAEVDILTLTATPIPRTLNMALAGMRDLSIIATPPPRRLAVKTFVREWNRPLLREACLREIHRGGQVYFLHNEVRSIDRIAAEVREIVPEAGVRVAHGQMPERELEQIMLDFYHQRFNVLVCSTIIESGIDIPNANTIILNRADRLGLAQLYQLRGRVGRSHHQAYAFLVIPSRKALTADATKRLEAIESIDTLGTGFTLATHDLEIRGAGELLGEEQSGQIHEVGFSMYSALLERAVAALKSGDEPALDVPLSPDTEIELGVAALIPEDYLPDVHSRLVIYKRIAGARELEDLRELQVEMIDRFGLLPDEVKNLFRTAELRLLALPMGIRKIELGAEHGRIVFNADPAIDGARLIQMVQTQPGRYRFHGGDKLQFKHDAVTVEERARILRALLEYIALTPIETATAQPG